MEKGEELAAGEWEKAEEESDDEVGENSGEAGGRSVDRSRVGMERRAAGCGMDGTRWEFAIQKLKKSSVLLFKSEKCGFL